MRTRQAVDRWSVAAGALLLIAAVVQPRSGYTPRSTSSRLDLLVDQPAISHSIVIAGGAQRVGRCAGHRRDPGLPVSLPPRRGNDEVKSASCKIIADGRRRSWPRITASPVNASRSWHVKVAPVRRPAGAQTYDEANAPDQWRGACWRCSSLGQLAVAADGGRRSCSISLQAMRVGLLTASSWATSGMFAGALVLFQIIVRSRWSRRFWLAGPRLPDLRADGPSGIPAAWRTGRAEALPSSADVRARRAAGAGSDGRAGGGGGQGGGGLGGLLKGRSAPAPAAGSAAGDRAPRPLSGAGRTRATTPKRKRKRRALRPAGRFPAAAAWARSGGRR